MTKSLFALIVVIFLVLISMASLILVIYNHIHKEPTDSEKQAEELAKEYNEDCVKNEDGKFCCKSIYEDDKLKERTCRQIDK